MDPTFSVLTLNFQTMKFSLFKRYSYMPQPIDWLVATIAKRLYRVRFSGAETIPATGGVLIVSNHLSYVDVIVLQLACPRPIRYMAFEGLMDKPFIRFAFKICRVISLGADKPMEGTRAAIRALKAGEVVCIFPEGGISRTGQLMEIRKGFEVIASHAKVPVVPASIDGIWGSVFSFSGNKYLWKSPRILGTDVFVAFGSPISCDKASPLVVRQALLDLGADAFSKRPVLRRSVGYEVARSMAKNPGRIAVVDRTSTRQELSAAKLFAVAAALSRRIKRTVPEKRVGIVLPAGAGSFIANLAVVFAGKIPVNMNFTAGRTSLESSLTVGEIKTVITAEIVRTKVPAFPWPEKTLDLRKEIAAAGGSRAALPWLAAIWLLPNQVIPKLLGIGKWGDRQEMGLLFTSGSAGEPKGVIISHRNLLSNCAQISSMAILPKSATMLACLPVFHSFGFTVNMWYPLLRGCKVVTVPSPLDTRRVIDAISAEAVTVFVGAPTFIRPLLKKATPGELKTLDLVVAGAERLPSDLSEAWLERFHVQIIEGYGLTETSPVSCVNQPTPPNPTATSEPQAGRKFGTVGRLLPGMTARIEDPETGAALALTDTGMLLLRGENVFGGYLSDAEKTKGALRNGWFVTGDLARFDEDGFLTIAGRLSRFSKIGGEMVPHGTLEQKIVEAFGFVGEDSPVVTVIGVPDPAKGEQLGLLTTKEIAADTLRERLSSAGLPNLWIPKMICKVEKIPLLGTGKVDIRTCKTLAEAFAEGAKS